MSNLQDDIIKYKKGELNPKEMHALEKKALNDPFLADALEGIENISVDELKQDIAQLNERIQGKKKTILFTPLRIAAGVVLVAASVFIVYKMTPKQENLALQTPKTKSPAPEKKESPKGEEVKGKQSVQSNSTQQGEVKREAEPPNQAKVKVKNDEGNSDLLALNKISKPKVETEAKPLDSDGFAYSTQKMDSVKVAKEPVVASAPMEVVQQAAVEEIQKEEKDSKRSLAKLEAANGAGIARKTQINFKTVTGKVVSAEDGSPLPGVNVVIKGTTEGTVTDADGNFKINTTNDQHLVFTFIGFQNTEIEAKGEDKLNIQLSLDQTQLSEVVVTGYGVKRDDNELIRKDAEPVGGVKAYNKYLDDNVRFPVQALENKVKGKVRIEFTVYTDGSLGEYKVVKSLGYGCDEEVIRLVKEGPKWNPTTENGQPVESIVRVGVKFDPSKAGR